MKSWHQSSKAAGFTLVEMLVVAPIVILLIGTIIYAIVQLTGDSLAERTSAALIGDVQEALDRIESDTKSSGAFLARSMTNLPTPQGYNNGVTAFMSTSTNGDMLILNTFATTENPNSPTRELVYLANLPYACGTANFKQNQVMTMNVIYFVKDNTLWRRTVAPLNYQTKDCITPEPWQRPSCAPGITGTMCKTQDEELIKGVASANFVVDYYNSASDTVASSGARSGVLATRQSALDLTNTIQVTITATASPSGRDIQQQGTLRVTRSGSLVKYATP